MRDRLTDEPQRVLPAGMRDRRHRMELETLEAQIEGVLEQRRRRLAVPGVDAGERPEPVRIFRTGAGHELDRVRVDLGRVDDRHDDAPLDPGLVEPGDAQLGLHLPPERRDVVDVHVGVDDHAEILCSST